MQICQLLETGSSSQDEEVRGMLTIVISEANPGISHPAPPH